MRQALYRAVVLSAACVTVLRALADGFDQIGYLN